MKIWFKEHPEIIHHWQKNQLKISHPKESSKFITFQFNSKSIKIENGERVKIFKRKLFNNIGEQVFKIRGYWINEFLTKEDTEIVRPKLKENQITAMICDSKYGKVLTTNKNLFTGWGTVYHILNSKEDAKRFLKKESNDDKIEITFYNSNYELIEMKKEN